MKEQKLFIVGTPIGNFDDITFRALDILKKVDIIACEDTRVTLKLLNHFDIKNKKLISYHNFNEKNSAKGIIDLILNKNLSVALVSDAGMPTISDPGFNLIEEARNQKINFVVIPGVSATTTAICASNLGSEFTFLGFGKAKKNQLVSQISSLKEGTYILFSAPHKIEFLLDIINKNIEDHSLFVGRELTKTFESYYWGNAKEIKEQLHNNLRGEMTLVLKINKSKKQKENKYKKSL